MTVGPAEADILAQECVTAERTHLLEGGHELRFLNGLWP